MCGQHSRVSSMNEETLIPIIRARLALKLHQQGLKVKEIATALNVTQPAVTQYIKGRRGNAAVKLSELDRFVEPLSEKLLSRNRMGLGGLETSELFETARQYMTMSSGTSSQAKGRMPSSRHSTHDILRQRLELELSAAEKYLELANRTKDAYAKLLLRMISSDSIKHADVVSQVLSWIENEGSGQLGLPDERLLKALLAVEDRANESSLGKRLDVEHPVARLLLEWIDIDEDKHERILRRLLKLVER